MNVKRDIQLIRFKISQLLDTENWTTSADLNILYRWIAIEKNNCSVSECTSQTTVTTRSKSKSLSRWMNPHLCLLIKEKKTSGLTKFSKHYWELCNINLFRTSDDSKRI